VEKPEKELCCAISGVTTTGGDGGERNTENVTDMCTDIQFGIMLRLIFVDGFPESPNFQLAPREKHFQAIIWTSIFLG